MGRVKKITWHDGSSTQYTYDAGGRIDYISDTVAGYIDHIYKDAGTWTSNPGVGRDRIAAEITPMGAVNYTYDEVGRRKTMTVPGQNPVAYTWFDNGLPDEISQNLGGAVRRYRFLHYPAGMRKELQSYRGSLTTPDMRTTYGFDAADRLLNIQHLKGTAVLEDLIYGYDRSENRTGYSRNETQPVPAPVINTAYDEANRMLSINGNTMTYDNNGNLRTVTNTCGKTTYTWDARNRLTAITGFKPDCGTLTASFKYDALGRRSQKIINNTKTQYLYDGLDIIQEIKSGSTVVNYLRTLNIDEPLARSVTGGAYRTYKADALGSTMALTDGTGTVKTKYTYDPFGRVAVSGEASDNPFQYTGRENDGTGLYYYRARYYSPEMQRFISEDPIGLAGGINQFVYVGNNPVNKIDPLGLHTVGFSGDGVLVVDDNGKPIGYYPGSSGSGGSTSDPWSGPIPEGTYRFDPNNFFQGKVLFLSNKADNCSFAALL